MTAALNSLQQLLWHVFVMAVGHRVGGAHAAVLP
jgi:hypothetical protein